MVSYFWRKRNIRVALSQKEGVLRRIDAIQALTAHPEALRVLEQIVNESGFDRLACQRLGYLEHPDALRVLLRLLVRYSTRDYQSKFTSVSDAISVCERLLSSIGEDAIPFLLNTGKNVLTWERDRSGQRKWQAHGLWKVKNFLGRIDTLEEKAAVKELDDLLRSIRTRELPDLLKTALEGNAFEEAESAINEIAGLGTPQARDALVLIRSQLPRVMVHSFMAQDPEVETGLSLKEYVWSQSSGRLGETLTGAERAFWDAARPAT